MILTVSSVVAYSTFACVSDLSIRLSKLRLVFLGKRDKIKFVSCIKRLSLHMEISFNLNMSSSLNIVFIL